MERLIINNQENTPQEKEETLSAEIIEKKIKQLLDGDERIQQVEPNVLEYFEDPDLFCALPKEITEYKENFIDFLLNMSRFSNTIYLERGKRGEEDVSGLFGEEVFVPETLNHSEKRNRRINVEFLRSQGINPSKVLFFRVTQPANEPKPEYYWTSDYFETKKGLTSEILPENRKTAIILVAGLDTINNNEGLIQDINEDDGLAVRQIGVGNFDQNLALAKIIPTNR